MKLSMAWLREWVDLRLTAEDLAEQMTLLGLEVDHIASGQPEFSGVVVAQIRSAEPHPNADTLRVCTVDSGGPELHSIVCGAPNARLGIKVPLAKVGARVAGGNRIRSATLRGVLSEGMLCSSAELGLSSDVGGLMELPADAPLGEPLESYLSLRDQVLEVELTPNRGDCLSIRGLARDIAAAHLLPLTAQRRPSVEPSIADVVPIIVDPSSACARYSGRVVRNLTPGASAPLWMIERLRRSGVRSISAAVDITNYVMLELGQPMHAFDLDKVRGGIQVRCAQVGETLTLLDGRSVDLAEDITVIADDRGAIGVGGIMGGLSTCVDEGTRNLFFESALFLPEGVAGRAWRLDAHTDSSHRFERGVDPRGQLEALERATELLLQVAGGHAGPVQDWVSPGGLPVGQELLLRRERCDRLLGVTLSNDDIEGILQRLGVQVARCATGWRVTPPSFRYDLRIEEDYIEELARVHGYARFPRTMRPFQPTLRPVTETTVTTGQLKNTLVGRGYQEVVTFSFVDHSVQCRLHPEASGLPLRNPISADLGVMRTSLAAGLLAVLKHNLNRQNSDVKIFETGLIYNVQDVDIKQENVLGGLISGRRFPEHWDHSADVSDFFDLKGDIEALLLRANGSDGKVLPGTQEFLHPGQSAELWVEDKNIGWFGRLHPQLQNLLDLSQTALLFQVSLGALTRSAVPRHTEISRFPSVRRDIAVVVPRSTSNAELVACVREFAPDWLQKIVTFDVYSGDKIDAGMKSVALGLILQDFSRTLADAEIDQVVAGVLFGLKQELGAILRV